MFPKLMLMKSHNNLNNYRFLLGKQRNVHFTQPQRLAKKFDSSKLGPLLEHHDPEQAKYMQEQLIVVNENDVPIRKGTKVECHISNGLDPILLHRAFSVFLFCGDKLLLQKRSKFKITYPGYWANSCCSHPLWNEEEMEEKNFLGVKRAAIRKLYHELGIEPQYVPIENFKYLKTVHYHHPGLAGWGEHEIDHCLYIKVDPTLKNKLINLNLNEVEEVRWMNRSETLVLVNGVRNIETDLRVTPWFQLISMGFLTEWFELHGEDKITENPKMEIVNFAAKKPLRNLTTAEEKKIKDRSFGGGVY